MVLRVRSTGSWLIGLWVLAGCGVETVGVLTLEAPGTPAYSGRGFIVHEWGTDTVVVGSDGSRQKGLQHEEEDLPAFVLDRRSLAGVAEPPVDVKMETPVTYFYSEVPRQVSVAVRFPLGLFTQWFPAVRASSTGQDAGLLDWSTVDVLDRGAEGGLLEAPLERYTWSHARQVAANPVAVGGQREKFLFYRGLGNFELPVAVTAAPGGGIELTRAGASEIGTVFLLNVAPDGTGRFTVRQGGFAGAASIEGVLPGLEDALPREVYAAALGVALIEALSGAGLYLDEAKAMVATWERQWFHTPGPRVLYLAPEAWTAASIPLAITPAPDRLTRVMVIRVEVITPELEARDVDAARMLGMSAERALEGERYFLALGRFAEPRFRRAVSLLGEPAWAERFLTTLSGE